MNLINKFTFYISLISLLLACNKPLVKTEINTEKSSNPVISETVDSEIINAIEPYKEQLDKKMNEVIGFAPEEMARAEYQSPLGNFVVDLVKTESEKSWNKKIDFAVLTNGGLRTSIPKGNVTIGNIFELMPFDNEIVVLELKGETIKEMMNYAADRGNTVFSGITYKVENKKPIEIIINGEVYHQDKIYTCAVSDYLAGGGDKMEFLKNSVKTNLIGILFRDAIINHIKDLSIESKQIVGKLDDRVDIVE